MSAIPVTMELIFQKDEALASLTEFQQQQQAIVNEMCSTQIMIPVKLDEVIIKSSMDEVRSMLASQPPILLPAALDTSMLESQMAEVRALAASAPPIQIPIEYVPVGGGGGVAAGIGSELESAAPTALATAAAVVAPEAAPEIYEMLEADGTYALAGSADAAGEMGAGVAGEGEAAELSEADFNRAPMSRAGARFAKNYRTPPKWYQYSGVGRHAFLGGYAAYRGIRSLLGRLNESDLDAQPDLDKQLEMERKDIEDEYGGLKRWLPGGENEYQQQMRYVNEGERTLDSDKRREADFKRDSAADQQMRHRLGDMNIELGGVGQGTTTQLRVRLAKELKDTVGDANAQIEKFHNDNPAAEKGRKLAQAMKDTAQRIYDAQIAVLNQQEQVATNQMFSEGTSAEMRVAGDFAGARRNDFDRKIEQRYEELKKTNPAMAEQFKNIVAPSLQKEFDADEKMGRARYANEDRYIEAEGLFRSTEITASMNHDPMSEAQAKNAEIDNNVQKLKDAAATEIDLEKQKQLSIQATAAERAGAAEKARNLADAQRELRDREYDVMETRERAHGMSYIASQHDIQRRLLDKSITPEQASAEMDAIEQDRNKELRGFNWRASEYRWEGRNRPRMAELERDESGIDEELRAHQDDPAMRAAIMNEGAAQLRAFAHPHQDSQWFDSASSYARALQTDVLNQDHQANQKALEAATKMEEAANKFIHAIDSGPSLVVVHDLH